MKGKDSPYYVDMDAYGGNFAEAIGAERADELAQLVASQYAFKMIGVKSLGDVIKTLTAEVDNAIEMYMVSSFLAVAMSKSKEIEDITPPSTPDQDKRGDNHL